MKKYMVLIALRGNFAVFKQCDYYHVTRTTPFEWLLDTPNLEEVEDLWGPLDRCSSPPDTPSGAEDYGTREGRQADSLQLNERLAVVERFLAIAFPNSWPDRK